MNERLACRLGFWSAALMSLLSFAYLATLVGFFATQGFVFPPSPWVQLTAGVITFLTVPLMVVLFAAIREQPGTHGILGTLGLSFALLFAAVVSINRFVQLTVIQQAPVGPQSADLARFQPYSTGSVMFALELLGWGFFIALAALFVAPLFAHGGLERSIRWTLVAFGAFSLVSVVGFATGTALTSAGFIAWGPLLLALAILLTVYFRRAGSSVVPHGASNKGVASNANG